MALHSINKGMIPSLFTTLYRDICLDNAKVRIWSVTWQKTAI